MVLRAVFMLFFRSVFMLIVGWASVVIANENEGRHSVEIIEQLHKYENVIVLETSDGTEGDAGVAMADAFKGVVLSEPMDAGVRVLFELDSIENSLKSAKHGDVVVGADPGCQVFYENCGLMGRLVSPPQEVACLESMRCLEFKFVHVGLESIIQQGALIIRTEVPIRSDGRCFDDRLSRHSGDGQSLESATRELECSTSQQGPFPPMSSVTPVASASLPPSMLRVANVYRQSDFCDEEGDWSREISGSKTLELIGGAIKFDTEYRANLVLSQTLIFDDSGVDGEVSMALCQLGEAGVSLASIPPDATIPLWAKGSGPYFVQLGWLPLVYSTTARLDLGLSGEAGVQISPFVVFSSEEHHDVAFVNSVTQGGGRQFSRLQVSPGQLTNTSVEAEASASLFPALQVNLYGVGGPFAGGEIKLHSFSYLAGSGRIAVGAELSSSLTAGVRERVTGKRWSHNWSLTQCGVGDGLDPSVPPCRDRAAADGVEQALFTHGDPF